MTIRLTNYIRDAFINAAMNDVPQVDYQAQIIKLVMEDITKQLPIVIQDALNSPAAKDYISKISASYGGVYIEVPGTVAQRYHHPTLTKPAQAKLEKLVAAKDAQTTERSVLRGKVHAAAYGCNNRKALAELLPEFEKYLPAEEEKTCRTLPAVANLMADFSKAGWPKDGKRVQA